MRILFFTPQQLWPVNSGSRLRNSHLVTALAKRCSVTLLQTLQPEDTGDDPPNPSLFNKVVTARKNSSYTMGMVLKGMLGPLPVTVYNYESADVFRALRDVLAAERYDAVQVETSNLYSYLKTIREAPGSPAVLLDWHNIDSLLMARYAVEAPNPAKRLVARRTAHLLSNLELRLLHECDAHSVVSEIDKAELLKRNPKARITVVPNGVDSEFFSPDVGQSPPSSTPDNVLFVGSMDYHANVDAVIWFARNIWPAISQRFPQLKFIVVGRSPGPEVRTLASDTVTVTGTVDDVRPYYASAAAVVVPLRVGSGTRLKILEAMAMGVPVISTTLGAEGIEAKHGQDILLADSEAEMVDAVGEVLATPALRRRIAEAGRTLVSKHYNWSKIGDRLFDAHRELVDARPRA